MLSVNLSEAPTWLIGIGVVVALGSAVGEVVGRFVQPPQPPSVSPDECFDLCSGWVVSWGPQACSCKIPEPEQDCGEGLAAAPPLRGGTL